ncbi:MAG: DNA polymerase III subunit gamma/tau [Planctomycetaceae bacterium]|jgi:DNA polymerase III subunit gamma/tau|nr:DNA polymerase III subunit gamma/tau [Planctomycetaceae bacterium]MDG2388834.1 DNA polymerase III subunit gamma/tau [Planctomycetaceae bacterium]
MTETSHYMVLARRFRPQEFGDVVGQQHIAQALQNAILGGRVAHAYLFTGARGVGKTSTARILAKALNCPHAKEAVPCNECEICTSISSGHDVDVLEIDGASNRRIDDIRDIRANVSIKSMRSKYKVYIIDEVHMLTTEAFNALLKTLEEPPPNVKFVFCTTEPQKVPDTILSRCQRFDFSSIETSSITERLRQIAEAEGYSVEEDALDLVARRAAGSMRDSQSLFDQLLAFGDSNLSADDVHRLLGTAGDDQLISVFEAIVNRSPAELLEKLDETLNSGVQLTEFFNQILAYTRDLMIVAAGAEKVSLQAVFNSQRSVLQNQADHWGLETIVTAMQILAEAKTQMGRSINSRPISELALIRLCHLGDLKTLAVAIKALEKGQPLMIGQPNNAVTNSQAHVPNTSVEPQKKNPLTEAEADSPTNNDASEECIVLDLSADNRREFMSQVVAKIEDKVKLHLSSSTESAIIEPNQLEIFFPVNYDLSRRYCEKPENLRLIENTASKLAGRPIQIRISVDRDSKPEEPVSQVKSKPEQTPRAIAADLSSVKDPLVHQAVELFKANLVKVQPMGNPSGNQES